jgi:hypothetical protein
LNLSERHTFLRCQTTLALERGFGQLQARAGREVLSALTPKLWAGQLRERLAGAHRIAGIDEEPRHSCRHWCADFGVPVRDQASHRTDRFGALSCARAPRHSR